MTTPKAEVASMLAALPENSRFEDIQYHLYVLEKVKHSLQRADTKGVISHKSAKARLEKWLAT